MAIDMQALINTAGATSPEEVVPFLSAKNKALAGVSANTTINTQQAEVQATAELAVGAAKSRASIDLGTLLTEQHAKSAASYAEYSNSFDGIMNDRNMAVEEVANDQRALLAEETDPTKNNIFKHPLKTIASVFRSGQLQDEVNAGIDLANTLGLMAQQQTEQYLIQQQNIAQETAFKKQVEIDLVLENQIVQQTALSNAAKIRADASKVATQAGMTATQSMQYAPEDVRDGGSGKKSTIDTPSDRVLWYWAKNKATNEESVPPLEQFASVRPDILNAWKASPTEEKQTYLISGNDYWLLKGTQEGAGLAPVAHATNRSSNAQNLSEQRYLDAKGYYKEIDAAGLSRVVENAQQMDEAALNANYGGDIAAAITKAKESGLDPVRTQVKIREIFEGTNPAVMRELGANNIVGSAVQNYAVPVKDAKGGSKLVAQSERVVRSIRQPTLLQQAAIAEVGEDVLGADLTAAASAILNTPNMESGDTLGSTLVKLDDLLSTVPALQDTKTRTKIIRAFLQNSLFQDAMNMSPAQAQTFVAAREYIVGKRVERGDADPARVLPIPAQPLPASFLESMAGKQDIPTLDLSDPAQLLEYMTLHRAEIRRKVDIEAKMNNQRMTFGRTGNL